MLAVGSALAHPGSPGPHVLLLRIYQWYINDIQGPYIKPPTGALDVNGKPWFRKRADGGDDDNMDNMAMWYSDCGNWFIGRLFCGMQVN